MAIFGRRWQQVGERLGEGGAGEVYLVKDSVANDGVLYALKRLKNNREDRVRRFEVEVEALRRLDHPNILRVIESQLEIEGEKPFFVTEYCERGNLTQLKLLEEDPIELLKLFLGICEGVRALHNSRGVHRDIKPENVLRRRDGTPVIGDFGLAYLADLEDDGRITTPFEQVGSRFFICPENEEGLVQPTHFCDIYSLGKLLYWMMSGGNKIQRRSHRGNDDNIVNKRQFYWAEHVNNILDRMLQIDPEKRQTNAAAVIRDVKEAIHLIEGRYNPLTRSDQGCRYCGKGTYRRVAYNEFHWYGIERQNEHTQRLLRCDNCGHMELFFVRQNEGAGDWISDAGVPTKS